jgi:hypothetical protein
MSGLIPSLFDFAVSFATVFFGEQDHLLGEIVDNLLVLFDSNPHQHHDRRDTRLSPVGHQWPAVPGPGFPLAISDPHLACGLEQLVALNLVDRSADIECIHS